MYRRTIKHFVEIYDILYVIVFVLVQRIYYDRI